MTKRESILSALKSTLVGIPGVPDASVYRSRVEPMTRGRVPAIVIEPVNDSPDLGVIPTLTWTLITRVTVIVRGDIPDQIADPIIESVHSKIMADTSLGGLVMYIEPGATSFEMIEGDQPIGIVTLEFRVLYRTSLSDLTL